jgi:hypothetical protein
MHSHKKDSAKLISNTICEDIALSTLSRDQGKEKQKRLGM